MKASSENYLDLVFASKNKKYGAYPLRRRQALYVSLSFLLSVLLIAGGFGISRALIRPDPDPAAQGTLRMQHRKVVGYSQLSAPPPIEAMPSPPPEKKAPRIVRQPKVATRKFLPPEVRPDAEVSEAVEVPTQAALKKVNPGKETVAGDTLGEAILNEWEEAVVELDIDLDPEPVEEEAPPPPPPVEEEEAPGPPKPEKIFTVVEVLPQFPGGDEALLAFLYENLEYPPIARENGIEGTVLLKLIIEPDGSISDIEVLQDLGGGCTEEVIRIVRLMPKWSPGIQAGHEVRVGVALPVQFRLTGE